MNPPEPRRVLITGGSRGIGRSCALLSGARGWSVALSYRADEASAASTARAVEAAGGAALAMRADVGVETDVQALFDQAERRFGGLDVVIVNAGIVGPSEKLAAMDAARIETILRTNLLGALLTAREAARRLARPMNEPSASLIFLSSVAAKLGSPGEYVDYAASKGALDTLTIGLSKELAPDNIRVNAVRPGIIATDIHASGGQPDRAQRLAPHLPLGRPGGADEVAETVLFLADHQRSSYVTGALIDVAGGR